MAPLLTSLHTVPEFRALKPAALEPTGFTGMAHDHIRIRGAGLVVRVPRVSQWGFAAHVNLAYQTACFRRAWPSGHTPRLHAVLPPSRDLPMGAMIVEEIVGRKPRLPEDLSSIAAALGAVHALAVPSRAERKPLLSPEHAIAHMMKTIEFQASFLGQADLAPNAASQIAEELDWARRHATEDERTPEPVSLILTDSHPGNFVIDPSGKAVFVDLEKAMYGLPAIDLAHATLYTSTRFDPEINAVLSGADTAAFYRTYLAGVGRARATELLPWLAPVRRIVWLRTMTWLVKWAVESRGVSGWSRQRLDARTLGHMEKYLEGMFDPETIARVRAEWH